MNRIDLWHNQIMGTPDQRAMGEVYCRGVIGDNSHAGICPQESTIREIRLPRGKRRKISCLLVATIMVSVAALAGWPCGSEAQIRLPQRTMAAAAEHCVASWYGLPYHGRKAANGEIYDMNKLTAAHRTLPFGTRVRVQNLANDKVVDVVINDRGPFIKGRGIDLSRAAARILGFQGAGLARVRLEIIPPLAQPLP